MTDGNTDRIIALCMKWQDRGLWKVARKTALQFAGYREKAKKARDTAYQIRNRRGETETELIRRLEHESERFEGFAEDRHAGTLAIHSEFIELETLVRKYFPQLLAHVPEANFFADAESAETSERIRHLKKLEGEIRHLQKPPGDLDEFTEPLWKGFIAEQLGKTWEALSKDMTVKPGTKPSAKKVCVSKASLRGSRIEEASERTRLLNLFEKRKRG